jgi:hypothetical protein
MPIDAVEQVVECLTEHIQEADKAGSENKSICEQFFISSSPLLTHTLRFNC